MSLAMPSQEKPRVKRKRDGGDEKSDADGRHAEDLVEDVQHDNLAGRVVQPVEGDGRTNAGSGRQVKKLKKKPTVPVVTDEQQVHDGRAEGEVHAGGAVGEEDDEGESVHSAALSRRRSMHEVARGPFSPKTPRPALSSRPSNITSSGHEREPVSTSMELEDKEDDEHEYNGDEADEDDTIIAHSPQTSVHSPRRSLPTRNTELQVQAHWERVIREQLAASMRAKLKSKQTMEMAIANTKADFLLSFTQLKDHQVAPVSNWGIAILKQMTANIMSCKYIAEAQKIAALSAVLPQNANAILYRSAVEELFLDMVAQIVLVGSNGIDEHWKRNSPYSLDTVTSIWQSFVAEGIVQQTNVSSVVPEVSWTDKQLEEFSDKRVRKEIEQLTQDVPVLGKEPGEHEFLLWLLGLGKVVISLELTRKSKPLHERVWRELGPELTLKTPARWKAIKAWITVPTHHTSWWSALSRRPNTWHQRLVL